MECLLAVTTLVQSSLRLGELVLISFERNEIIFHMKVFMLLIASLGFGSCMAQDSDTCSVYSINSLKTVYNTQMWNGLTRTDTVYYNYIFFSLDLAKLREMEKWAVQQGFSVILRPMSNPNSETGHMIIIEKIMKYNKEALFRQEVYSISDKRKELGIYVCNGTALGAGKGFKSLKPKDK